MRNFLVNICGCSQDWTPAHFVSDTVAALKKQIGPRKVIMALSGGVDSTVAATLIHRAIGDRLVGIFVDNGVLRKNEFGQVLETYRQIGLNVKGVDASALFYRELAGKTDPEAKRKTIGRLFIDVFQQEAAQGRRCGIAGTRDDLPGCDREYLGTWAFVDDQSRIIMSAGLPDKMHLELVEPLRYLFKDEVRRVGAELGIPDELLQRHPFPGPGLAIRILGEVTAEKVQLLQDADDVFMRGLKEHHLYSLFGRRGRSCCR